jgi:hypothetical protein
MALPPLQAPVQIPPVTCWNNLEPFLLAGDDLGCRDFLA